MSGMDFLGPARETGHLCHLNIIGNNGFDIWLQMQVHVDGDKDVPQTEKARITEDLKLFLVPVREKLLQFEQELVER